MKRLSRVAAGVLGISAAVAAPAAADPFWLYQGNAAEPVTRGNFYTGFSIFGGLQQLPSVRSTISLFATPMGPFLSASTFDRDPQGVQPGGMIGYMFADGSMPAWMGQRVRLQLSGDMLFYSATTNRTSAYPMEGGMTMAGIGGTTLASTVLSGAGTLVEDFRVRREGFGVELKLISDHPVGPNVVLSPSISIFGGQTYDWYRLQARFVDSVNYNPAQINQWLNTDEFGLRIGLAGQWQFAPGWSLNLAGHAGMVYLRSKLNGEDCYGAATVAFGSNCGPSNPDYYGSVVNTRSTAVGFRGGASASISADLRYAIVTVGGSFRYDSHIPGVSNPQFRSQTFFGNGIVGGNPAARIKYAGGFAYGAFLRIAVPLNGFGL